MKLFGYKFMIKIDEDEWYVVYKKRFLFWTLVGYATDYKDALNKIECFKFREYHS